MILIKPTINKYLFAFWHILLPIYQKGYAYWLSYKLSSNQGFYKYE